MSQISGNGILNLDFSSQIFFPKDLANIINQEAADPNVLFK